MFIRTVRADVQLARETASGNGFFFRGFILDKISLVAMHASASRT